MTIVTRSPESDAARPVRARPRRTAKGVPKPPVPWWRRPRQSYTVVVALGATLFTIGVGLIYIPAALIVAGLAIGGLGMVGLAITVRGMS